MSGLILRVGEFEFEFSFFGAEHDGLPFHPADHIEGSARLAAQRHLQQVFLDAGLDGLAQRGLDLEEAIGRAQTADALMRTLVVVMLDPEANALARLLETAELSAREEVLPDRLPEALDFAQRHGVLRTRLEVGHSILLQLGFEARSAAPRSILPAVVGEHLLGRLKLRDRLAIHFDHGLRRGAAKQIRTDDETGVVIHEGDDIGIAPAEPEGEDVRLPHLVGRGALEEARARHVALPWHDGRRNEVGLVQLLAHRLRAGLEEEDPPQPLRDGFDAKGGIFLFERDDPVGDGWWQLGPTSDWRCVRLESLFAELPILFDPARERLLADAGLLGNEPAAEALL